MFDTRSGFWLMASIGIVSLLATTATILFAPDDELTQEAFSAAIGFPMAVILPMIAILSVTSEWTQRSGADHLHAGAEPRARDRRQVLATRSRSPSSRCSLALAVGALGNIVGSGIAGVDTVWDVTLRTSR